MGTKGEVKTIYPGVFTRKSKRKFPGVKEVFSLVIRYRFEGVEKHEVIGRNIDGWNIRKAANEKMLRENGKSAPNAPKKKEVWTLDKLWVMYLEGSEMKSKKHQQDLYENFIKPRFGHLPLNKITGLLMEEFKLFMLGKNPHEKKYSAAYIKAVAGIPGRVSTWARDLSIITAGETVPYKKLNLPKIDNVRIELVDPLVIKNVFALLEKKDEELKIVEWLTLLLVFTGRRPREIMALKWENIDFEKRQFHLLDTKTKKLQIIPASELTLKIFSRIPRHSDEWIFVGVRGNHVGRVESPAARKCATSLGVPPDFRPLYWARKIFASIALNYGVVDRISKIFIGHTTKPSDNFARYAAPFAKKLNIEINNMVQYFRDYSDGGFDGEFKAADVTE